ncbi:hypothetical protein RCL_jg5071.t1 [Rhizophagus clarus]|uniref:Uncharacterized protein n=1 Tax=Rhizophagus clarus TaxID=94130 RepID=A0A8H3LB84_9GLOM|nr:hypothetical protein RCL_jg5071.t1 [Rhizophagus clarus]
MIGQVVEWCIRKGLQARAKIINPIIAKDETQAYIYQNQIHLSPWWWSIQAVLGLIDGLLIMLTFHGMFTIKDYYCNKSEK